jgi:hypothetical protein
VSAVRREATLHVSGLVPLEELNREPYEGLWAADFKLHSVELGVALSQLETRGVVRSSPPSSEPVVTDVSGETAYLGLYGAYYVPLLGYTPNATLGLLPEVHARLALESSDTAGESKEFPGWLFELPLLIMLRLGTHASRYGDWSPSEDWSVSLGAGAGIAAVAFETEGPLEDSGAFIAPALRLEVYFGVLKFGFETWLGEARPFSSGATAREFWYRNTAYMLSARMASGAEK